MKKSKGVVYCVTNTRNGKKYVGISTRGAKERWARHVYDAQRGSKLPLHRAIRKYGEDAFTMRVLARSDDWEQLCQLEQHYIAKLKTHVRHGGYNCTAGGEGTVDLPEESRARIGAAWRRLNADPEFAARRDAGTRRLWQDDAHRAKISEVSRRVAKRQWQDEEFRAKHLKAMKRLWTDDEFRAKISEVSRRVAKRQWQDEEFRAKHLKAMKRLWTDDEFRAKQAATASKTGKIVMKRLWADEEFRAKSIAAASKTMKRLHADPEFRAKNIAAVKRLWQDEEFRAKKSAAVKRQWADDEFRAKQAAAAKRLWADDAYRAKKSEEAKTTMKRLWQDDEFRAKMIEVRRTPFNDFCREHDLKPKNVRYHLRKRGIYGLKNINHPIVREVLDEMIAQRRMTQPAKKPRRGGTTGLTLH